MLALAEGKHIDVDHVHRLHDTDLNACIGLDNQQLAAYLAMLEESAERRAGRAPYGHTTAAQCRQCGPVWVHPSMVAGLPIVRGWTHVHGCPWCFVRVAGAYISRPPVACRSCRHYQPATTNPESGMGICGAGKGLFYPGSTQVCA
ncbi:MAG: hypothetical protein WAM90_03545, partial [Rhodanobacter sp.]